MSLACFEDACVLPSKALMNKENKNLQTILVVDDEPLVLKYTATVISGFGYKQIFKAKCALEAREILLTQPCALIICDVYLPDGDGRQVLREALEINPDATGVLFTGFSTIDLPLPPELEGRVQFLEKPFMADDISQLLAETFERTPEAVPA